MTALDQPPAGIDLDPTAFRAAMRQLAGAVSVITAGRGAGRTGLTATSVTSLSVDPPTILVCVNLAASALATIRAEAHFAVNILSSDQQSVADRFAGRTGLKGADRYREAEWTVLATGAPALVDAVGVIDADLEETIERHSHAILIGRVRAVTARPAAGGLIYWRGGYRPLDPA